MMMFPHRTNEIPRRFAALRSAVCPPEGHPDDVLDWIL
jgi:hypothetical protein